MLVDAFECEIGLQKSEMMSGGRKGRSGGGKTRKGLGPRRDMSPSLLAPKSQATASLQTTAGSVGQSSQPTERKRATTGQQSPARIMPAADEQRIPLFSTLAFHLLDCRHQAQRAEMRHERRTKAENKLFKTTTE